MKKSIRLSLLLLVFLTAVLTLSSCIGTVATTPTTNATTSFEVVFVAGDGVVLKTETVELGQSATAPEVPERQGYAFVGWDTDFSNVDCSMTVTALYARIWTVQFVDVAGNLVKSYLVVDGEAAPTPPINPYKENYTFAGWDQDYSAVTSDMIIHPVFEENAKFTVTFLGFDDEVLSTQVVYAGYGATAPFAPAVTHHTFKGWDKDFSCVSEDLTVNAIYEEDAKYTVSFYDHEGNLLKAEEVYAGEDATAPSLSLAPHFNFVGWDSDFTGVRSDLTVSAIVTEDAKFTVVFVDFNGDVLKTEVVYVGEAATAPSTPSHYNKEFTGWDKAFQNVQDDLTVTAQYNQYYDVVFYDHLGNLLSEQKVLAGEAATAPTLTLAPHFNLSGWDKDFASVTSDLTVNAIVVEDAKFTVVFLDRDGEVLSSQIVYVGENAIAPNAPVIEGYTFMGWDKNFENVQEDLTVSPIYRDDNMFMVIFKDASGNVLKTEEVRRGEAAEAPVAPFIDNYTFAGWDKDFGNVQDNLVVNATYTENAKYTVQFVDFNGNVLKTEVVYVGKDATAPADPSRENYDFAGWDKAFQNVQGDLTVTATYTEHEKFTVTFVDFDGSVLKSEVVYIGKDATAPVAPVHHNKVFKGWDKAFQSVQGDLTVTAQYDQYYTVAFYDHLGNKLIEQTVLEGTDATSPTLSLAPHFSFKGWDKAFVNVHADLTVTAIVEEDAKFTVTFVDHNGDVLKAEVVYVGENATAPATPSYDNLMFNGWDKTFQNVQGDLTVTATYLPCFTVTFKGHDGTVLKTEKVMEGAGATAPAAPIVVGYIFSGWDKDFSAVTANITVTAKYVVVEYNVSFSVVGSTAPATQVIAHGGLVTRPADPVREGFDFIEWRLNGVKYDFAAPVVGDMTLVAHFKSNGQMPAISNTAFKIDPLELELWVGFTLKLNVMPNGETYDIVANTDITFDFISTDPEVISIEDDGTFTSHALGSAKIYAVVTKGGTYVGSKDTYTAEVGDVIGICYMSVVETAEYYQNFLDNPDTQKITLGSTSTDRIDKNDFLSYPTGDYGSANIALWYNGTEAVFTATVDDNPNVMGDWSKWAVFAEDFGIPTTFISPSLSGYVNEGTLWQVISSSEYAMVQSHGATHLAINQHHSTARIWNEFYYGRLQISLTGGNDSLIIGYANGTNYAPISSLFFIGGRGVAGHLNGVEKINYNTLASFSGFPSDIPGKMETLLGANASNGWMSVHYHQMGNSSGSIRAVYEQMYPYIESGRLWAALFADASQYGQERDTATLTMIEAGANVIRLSVTDQMNDILFYHPLSVRVKVDASWTGARAYQNGEEVNVRIITENGETYLMVDAVPDKGEVTVVRTSVDVLEQNNSMIRVNVTDALGGTGTMTLSFPVSYSYAYATQGGAQIPAYVKDGMVYVTAAANGGEVQIVPVTYQYSHLDSYPMSLIYNGCVAPDPTIPITIATPMEMVMFSEYVNAGNSLAGFTIELIADLDMTGVDYRGAGFDFVYKGSSGVYMSRPFSGTFNGNNHKIYNLNINQLTIDAGVFGYILDATIRDLKVEANISGGERVAGIATYASKSLITRCSFTGNVTASVIHKNQATGRTVGGIAGLVRNGTVIENCIVNGTITVIDCESYDIVMYNIGGIVGSLGAGTINNCAIYGNVIAEGNSANVGGIVGNVEASGEGGLRIISNCFASVNVVGGEYVGGLCGQVSCNSSSRSSNIYNCSIIGTVTGKERVGGLAGQSSGLSAHMKNCFAAVTVNAPEGATYVGTISGNFKADSYGIRIDGNYYVGSLNPGMPIAVKESGSGSFSGTDVADGAAALSGLNTVAGGNAAYYEWRLVDGVPTPCYEEVYSVTFVDKNGDKISSVTLPKGYAATAPTPPVFTGFEFIGWDKAFDNVTADIVVTAQYKEVIIYTVTFVGKNGETLKSEQVNEGRDATAPAAPALDGWRFDGWDTVYTAVSGNLTVTAKYVKTWTVTYLDVDGNVWLTEVYDQGTVPSLAIAPAVKGSTFMGWNVDALPALEQDYVLTPVYETRAATSAVEYKVMHWHFGGNTVYTGGYQKNIQNAVAAADPDIIIFSGMDSYTLKNPKTVFCFESSGYSCWAHGAGSSNSPAAADEAVHRYVGSGVAVYYKTDLFTPAGEVGHAFPGGDRVSQITVFPLANNEGVIVPVVASYMVSTATEAQRAKWVTDLKELLGTGCDAAIIRLYVEGNNPPDASWSNSFNQGTDENGFSLVCDGGTNVKKQQGEHNSTTAHYAFIMTYGSDLPTVAMSNLASVAITEDSTVYSNNHGSSSTAFFDVAYCFTVSIGATGGEE